MRIITSDWIQLPEGVAAQRACFALSDVHGFSGFMRMGLNHISSISQGHELVLVGDLINRGPDSLGCVREAVNAKDNKAFSSVKAVRGNHCDILKFFVENPKDAEAKWALSKMGGADLMKLFKADKSGFKDCEKYIDMSKKHYLNGGVLFIHASPDPSKRLTEQTEKDLFWSTKFLEYKGGWGMITGKKAVLCHGHVHHGVNAATVSQEELTKRYENFATVFARVPLDAKTPVTKSLTIAEFVEDKFRVHAVS